MPRRIQLAARQRQAAESAHPEPVAAPQGAKRTPAKGKARPAAKKAAKKAKRRAR